MSVPSARYYELADLGIAKRLGGFLWLASALIIAILLPLSTPDDADVGDSGWIIGVGTVFTCVALGLRLARQSEEVTPNELLGHCYIALVVAAALMWVAGAFAPYTELALIPTLYAAAVHPPRRVLAYLVVVAVVLATPLLYESTTAVLAEELARFLIWSVLALVATTFTASVRIHRAGLLQEGDEARVQARADPLTNLGNRRAFDEALASATMRAGRTGSSLSTILIDLDSFKQINDEHGLIAGDHCLREVAGVLRTAVRRPDACFRWGGDEFVVLADVDRAGADLLAARLAAAVADDCRRPDGSPVRLHTGAAQFGPDGDDAETLLTAAGGALKSAGPGSD